MAGRRPKPTNLKVLKGTFRKCRANPNEPQPDPGTPRCPGFIKGLARKEWTHLVAQLSKTRVLTKQDRGMLALYCATYAQIIEAIESGKELSASLLAQCRLLGEAFGLTPASRSRTHSTPTEEGTNEWEDLAVRSRR